MSMSVTGEAVAAPRPATQWLGTWRFPALLESWVWRLRVGIWVSIVAFYVLSFNGLWRITPDSALYLCIARNIARGEGYVYHGEAHRMAYPGLPYLLAGLMKVSEQHAIALADLVMLISTLLTLVLCYRMFRLVVRPGAALVVTVFTAVNFAIYELAFSILTDIPFLLGSVVVLAGGALCGVLPASPLDQEAKPASARERKSGFVMLVAGMALCAVMRPIFYALAACAILASVMTALRLRKKKHLLAAIGLAACIGLVYLIICHADPRRATTPQDIYEEAISVYIQSAFTHWEVPLRYAWRLITPELPFAFFGFSWGYYTNPIPTALLGIAAVWILRRWPMAMLWIAATLGMQVLVRSVPRYMLPIVPLLALTWWEAASRIGRRAPRHLANVIAIAAFCVMLPNAGRCVGLWYDQYRRPFVNYYRHGNYEAIWEASLIVKRDVPADAVIIAPEKLSGVLTYLADREAFELNDPRLSRFAGRPLWVVTPRNEKTDQEILSRGFRMEGATDETLSQHRKEGVLQLRKAHWPGQ